jgi:hypothetical protein
MPKANLSTRTGEGRYVWPGSCRGGMYGEQQKPNHAFRTTESSLQLVVPVCHSSPLSWSLRSLAHDSVALGVLHDMRFHPTQPYPHEQ